MSNKIELVKKLIALSQSDNVNEAANAAAKAAELMEKYSIDEALLAAEMARESGEMPDVEVNEGMIFSTGGNLPGWVRFLSDHVAETRRCYPFFRGSTCWAVGTEENLEEVRFLMGWLVGEVERLLKVERKKLKKEGVHHNRSQGKIWSNNFKLGAVSAIGNRLRQQVRDQRERLTMDRDERYQLAIEENDHETIMELDQNKYSLATVNHALARLDQEVTVADTWVKDNLKLRAAPKIRYNYNSDGYGAGRRAGKRANLSGKSLTG